MQCCVRHDGCAGVVLAVGCMFAKGANVPGHITATRHRGGRLIALVASTALMAACGITGLVGAKTANASTRRDSYSDTVGNVAFESARQKYGLAKNMSEGATLHTFEWSFKTIENAIPAIAEAGFTSVQTEPVSAIHAGSNGRRFTKNWYYAYQPTDTTVGNWIVGSESDLRSLCRTAHSYGVRIIVDVVANHMTSDTGAIAARWKNSGYYHHDCNDGNVSDWNNRYQVTHCKLLGLQDLNTDGNRAVGDMMADFLRRLVDDGVDGFRFDAAKHIELPGEYNNSSYWTRILANGAQYQYGEILHDGISRDADYARLFSSSDKAGGGITASSYGFKLRGALNSRTLDAGSLSSWDSAGVQASNLTSWVESHDNYSNDSRESTGMSQWQMTMGWGVIGSRAGTMSLYFDRPAGSGGSSPQFSEQTQLGDAGSDSWKDPQVSAVNHFRNAMDNEDAAEYLRNCGPKSCLMVERYKSDGSADTDGVTVVNMGGRQSLAGLSTTLDDGTYTDQVGGGRISVSGGRITSGTAPAGKVSVFFNRHNGVPSVSVSADRTGFTSGTLDVTLHSSSVTGARYATSEGRSGSFSDGDVITIGSGTAVGASVTVTVSGTQPDGTTISRSFTFHKKDPAARTIVYARRPGSWNRLFAYAYVDDPTASRVAQNAAWLGVEMKAADACGKAAGYDYMYEIPEGLSGSVRVIFDNGEKNGTLKYPADTTEGENAAGLAADGTAAWDGDISDPVARAWTDISCPSGQRVRSVSLDRTDVTLDVTHGSATARLTATTDPRGAAVTWGSSDPTVASVSSDGEVMAHKPGVATITAKAADGISASASIRVVRQSVPASGDVLYAHKPAGWGSIYAYIYTGDGSSARSNAGWPGVPMTAMRADDGCAEAGTYRLRVPDLGSGTYRVIFSDNGSGSNRYPGNMAPGMAFHRGTPAVWDGSATRLSSPSCGAGPVTPVTPGSATAVYARKPAGWGSIYAYIYTGDGPSARSNALWPGIAMKRMDAPDSCAQKGTYRIEVPDLGTGTYRVIFSDNGNALNRYPGNMAPGMAFRRGTPAVWDGSSTTMAALACTATPVVPASSVTISGTGAKDGRLTMTTGAAVRLTATVHPDGATDKKVVWSSSDPSVALVSSDGTVTAKRAGTAILTATAGTACATLAVTVQDPVFAITGAGVSDGRLTLSDGQTIQLAAVNRPSGDSRWWSDGDAVAVTGTGYAIAVQKGTCRVHLRCGNKTALLEITVR